MFVFGDDFGLYFERGWYEIWYSVEINNGLYDICVFIFIVKGIFCK